MSTIFKIVFFCCTSNEDTNDAIESVDKKGENKAPNGILSHEMIEVTIHNQPPVAPNIREIRSDSSESCSISSQSNKED